MLGNLLLIPGLGHIELNMVKGLFKLLWHIYFKELALILGFRTIRARTCDQNASDNHKAMQMLDMYLFSLAVELVFEYCKENKVTPSIDGYFTFLYEAQNENVIFAFEAVYILKPHSHDENLKT